VSAAAFAEGRRGTVKPRLDADLVVLDRDILAGGPSAIMGTEIALTVVGGEIVHRSEDAG
jgi:predicted amidohydrolase YtcJ